MSDLIFTTLSDQIANIDAVPGLTNCVAVTIQLDTILKYARKEPWTVHLYRKGNTDKQNMEMFNVSFLQSYPLGRDV